mmetsp:Transcript_5308/g.11625  ORF Transcript_5308/g.11625 Transcript_5308/m.11625 type:complete len:222 (-) Transcript_5308:555-1220(-)
MQPLVPTNQLIRKRQPGHQPPFLQPEYRAKAPRKENALHDRERHETLGERRIRTNILLRPRRLPLHAGYRRMGRKQPLPLVRIGNVRVDEEAVGLLVDALHGHLKAVEAPRFGDGDLAAESLGEVFHDDAVGSGEEGEDHGDEVSFVVAEVVVPVIEVAGEVDFVGRPEARDVLFVHGPEVEVGYWEEAEARACVVGAADDFLVVVIFFFFGVVDGSAFCK